MKKIKTIMEWYAGHLNKYWQVLTVRKQHQCIRYFFAGYLLLTAIVIFKVCQDAGKSDGIVIGHIENPVLSKSESTVNPQDKASTILKNQLYERK